MARTSLYIYAPAVAALLGLAVPSHVWPQEQTRLIQLSAEQARSLGVETGVVVRRASAASAPLPAQVMLPLGQQKVVAMPLDGLVERVSVALNDHVRAGQPLARIQSPALIEAQRGLLQASTQHQLAQRTLARDAELHREGIIAESRYLSAKSAEAEAAAALAERRQLLALYGMSGSAIQKLLSSRQLSATIELVAPADGVILELPAAPGQRLQAAAPIARLASLASLWLEVQLPASRVYAVAPGSRVQVLTAGAVGRVRSVGSAVHPENQTVAVHVQLTEGTRLLRPGQSVEAVIELAHSRGACWQVPPGALARMEGRSFVFVQAAEGFRPVPVEIAEESATGPCVDGALETEDRIAVRGVAALKARLAGIGG